MKINDVLVRPIVTEKGVNLVKGSVYSFEINLKANKNQVRNILEKLYKVKVKKIRIFIRKGKIKKVGRKMVLKKTPDIKIAFVALKEGKIDLFPQA